MRLSIILLAIVIFSSCAEDCLLTLKNPKLYSCTTTPNTEPAALVDGYYHSEYQFGTLNFTIEFDHYGGGHCNYSWANYPLEETIEITCDNPISLDGIVINPNESLREIFEIEKFETESFFIAFLLKLKEDIDVEINPGNFTFNFVLETENGEQMSDKCILKYE